MLCELLYGFFHAFQDRPKAFRRFFFCFPFSGFQAYKAFFPNMNNLTFGEVMMDILAGIWYDK
jgi:hypothetical protein